MKDPREEYKSRFDAMAQEPPRFTELLGTAMRDADEAAEEFLAQKEKETSL